MEEFLHKRTLTIYWIMLFVHCIFQFYESCYRAVTKPMLVPLLLLYLLLNDRTIGKPVGKFMFYIGLFLAFFGDVLLIIINDTFLLSGMIAFMLMNVFYSIAFLYLNKFTLKSILPVVISAALLFLTGYWLYTFLGNEMGDYQMPVLIYMFTVGVMVCLAVNASLNEKYKNIALTYLVPGAVIFLVENILIALNWFHWGGNKNVYIAIMITYGTAQFLMVKGILKAYPTADNPIAYPVE